MLRIKIFFLFSFLLLISLACSTSPSPDVKTNAVSPVNANVPANLPPGLSTSPVPLNGDPIPGIPNPKAAGANNTSKPAATPGIPDPKTIGKKPLSKGTTPTPGIPDEETLKRQMGNLLKDANVVNPLSNTDSNSIKSLTNKIRPVRKP